MYAQDESCDQLESEEETEVSAPSFKSEIKTYGVIPPPPGYVPPSQEEVEKEETTSLESSEETEPVPKRRRKHRRQQEKKSITEQFHNDDDDKMLTKNQKRKLKKKRRKEKQKNEGKSMAFVFEAQTDDKGDNEVCSVTTADKEDLQNFFDAVWDIYCLKEKEKNLVTVESFTNLVQCIKVSQEKDQMKVLIELCRIKRLITIGDYKTAREYIDVFKSDQISLMSDDVKNMAAILFEYWMTDIGDKG